MLGTQHSRLLYSPACLQYRLRRSFLQTYFECEQNIFLEWNWQNLKESEPYGEQCGFTLFFYMLFCWYKLLFIILFLIYFFFQDLPTDFAGYVRKHRFKRLELQGSKNTFIVQCKLLVHNSPKKSTKFGKGWKDFCRFNRLKEGDVIVFAAHNQMRKKKIKVYIKKEFF